MPVVVAHDQQRVLFASADLEHLSCALGRPVLAQCEALGMRATTWDLVRELAMAEAKTTGKPVLVVLRCVPCPPGRTLDGLVMRPDHTALVTEFGNHRVHHVDLETGATLGLYGRPGRGEGELTNPWAIAVIGETVYVLDSGNGRIEAFRAPALVRRTAGGAG